MNQPSPESFATAFCAKTDCSINRFGDTMMRMCFSLPAPINRIAQVLTYVYPSYFEIDLLAIRRLALVCNRTQFQSEVEKLHYEQRRDRGIFHHPIPFGLSLRKLMKLQNMLAI